MHPPSGSDRGRAVAGADEIIRLFGLRRHPTEGGYFVETYRSSDVCEADDRPDRYRCPRAVSTAIYYLLTAETRSEMHRLRSDEVYHFYLGDPVTMLNVRPDGSADVLTLGQDVAAGERLQHVVPRDVWQGAHLHEGGRFALLGTTVAPGFDYADYESGAREELLALCPEQRDVILRLTNART